jgi:IclR family mhp operon transcriptional activator
MSGTMAQKKRERVGQPPKRSVPAVRAVHRAIDILDYLAEHGPTGLQQLYVGTGISKGALRRLLGTLVARRFIRIGITDGMYRTNVSAPMAINSQAIVRVGHLVEVARPHMVALTERIRWPSALHLYDRGRMCIIESTHGMTLFGTVARLRPHSELNVFAAASGLALLANKDDDFVLQLVDELKNDEFWSLSRFRLSPARLLDHLREIRRKGYATRRATQGRFDNRNAIAVPIFDGRAAIGGVTLSWPRKIAPAEDFAAQHLSALRSVAQSISKRLAEDK